MPDSGVIIIDDDPPAPAPRRGRRARTSKPIVISSDEEEYEPRPVPKKQPKKKTATKRAAGADPDADDAEQPSPGKQKRPKKQKEPVEKRTDAHGKTVRFAASQSQGVYQRIQRALPGSAHRMFLISTKEIAPAGAAGGRAQEFAVLGATGNVYDVNISRHPHCTCPDHAKGNLCKHILFVMLRVLKLATDNPLVWQKALLTKEVEEVLSGAHSPQGAEHLAGVLADERVRRAYSAAAGEGGPADEDGAAGGAGGRRAVEGDCPICFDELKEGGEALEWCKSCGNNMHKSCWDRWAVTKRQIGAPVTCVYCRAPWHDDAAAAGGSPGGGSYLNLAQHSSAHANAANTTLERLYGANAMWINHHAGGGSRAGASRMWRDGYGY